MPSALPDGEPAPDDGALPDWAVETVSSRPFGFYVHIPFCRVRCGYCDFNTYTFTELGSDSARGSYAQSVISEVRAARQILGSAEVSVETIFFGGGTPTLLSPSDLGSIVAAIDAEFGLAEGVEITTEANPDSVAQWDLEELRAAGFNRISYGMQSAVPAVLRTLERTHDPLRVPAAVQWAREAGFDKVSLDLIYGTPGESISDWETSLESALACRPDHLSAYALIVEEGTGLARRVRRGQIPAPDDDDLADKYLLAEERLTAAGLQWYEVSNWATTPDQECLHNLFYWTGANWWGAGPGAHSHIGGVRWWNRKHPTAYADRLAAGLSPAQSRELLGAEDQRVERVLLELRLRQGLHTSVLTDAGRAQLPDLLSRELIESEALAADRIVLSTAGRLLADAVLHALLP